ncbi:MAG: ammonium transporter [Actinomycetota bacterium]|nr:ammonium transporter [Rubrobacter sp.]MDQ3507231.1 ammonium transporter [Actinomycetota bacterium]
MRRLFMLSITSALMVLALPAVAFAQEGLSPTETVAVLDTMWVMLAFVLVLFMQAGFAMLEVGFSRMKNVGNVVAKILANMAIGAIVFWAIGFGIAFGAGNPFFGLEGWFLSGNIDAGTIPLSMLFIFQAAFAMVALAIVWGTMLERTKFSVYLIFAIIFVGIIYPMGAHWVWSDEGWIGALGKQDFAGSTVVHLSAAMAALAGTIIVGPRLGKFDDNGRPQLMPGHNMPLAVLGVLILWLGWQGFNPGSTLAATVDIADIALTTNLAAAAGIIGAMLITYFYKGFVDVGMAGNGAIAGLVAITATCAFVAPWAAVVIGLIAGVVMYATALLMDRIGIDDPVGAIAAHGMGGVWGTLSAGLFTTPALAEANGGLPGLFYGGGFTQLGVQAVSIAAVGGFVFFASLAVFGILKATIGIRVKPEHELNGLDISDHGGYGYSEGLVATDQPNGNGYGTSDRRETTGSTT